MSYQEDRECDLMAPYVIPGFLGIVLIGKALGLQIETVFVAHVAFFIILGLYFRGK